MSNIQSKKTKEEVIEAALAFDPNAFRDLETGRVPWMNLTHLYSEPEVGMQEFSVTLLDVVDLLFDQALAKEDYERCHNLAAYKKSNR